MEESDREALETLRALTLQIMLIAAGVFGVVGGFITASDKPFYWVSVLIVSMSAFAVSGFFGYLVHGLIIGFLGKDKQFSPHQKPVQVVVLLQILCFIIGSALFIVFVSANVTAAKAQEELFAVLKDPYIEAIGLTFDAWDSKDLHAKTEAIRPAFEALIQRRIESPEYEFERAPDYGATMTARFDALGSEIVPELSLTPGARLMLLGSAADRLPDLSQQLASPADFREKFFAETMITLGASQMAAKDMGLSAIDSRAVSSTYQQFRSTIYPFCCWDKYR